MAITVQMRAKGGMTIPVELREKYRFDEGDVFTLLDLEDGSLVLVPRISLVPKLVAEMERLREEAGLTVEDLVQDLPELRRQVFEEGSGRANKS